jgi:hypothetical protein
MNADTQTIILGIAGLVATLISSGLGLFFTSRARADPLREQLYIKQVEITSRAARLFGRMCTYTTILQDPETSDFKEQAWDDLREAVEELGEVSHSSAVLLPTDIYAGVKRLEGLVLDFLVAHATGEDTGNFSETLASHSGKVLLLARAYLGVDELSVESASLFTNRRRLRAFAETKPERLAEIARQRKSSRVNAESEDR